jgi:hypothetical protein
MGDQEKAALQFQQDLWLQFRISVCIPGVNTAITQDDIKGSLPCLSETYQSRIAGLMHQCEVEKDQSFDEMSAQKEATFSKAPDGFNIDNHMVEFVVTQNVTELRSLPTRTARSFVKLHAGYRNVADCRVQGPDGQWWLVIGNGHNNGRLAYLEAQAVTTEMQVDNKANK